METMSIPAAGAADQRRPADMGSAPCTVYARTARIHAHVALRRSRRLDNAREDHAQVPLVPTDVAPSFLNRKNEPLRIVGAAPGATLYLNRGMSVPAALHLKLPRT